MWEVVDPSEIPTLLEAIKQHKCITCYDEIDPCDGVFYCHTCDPREE